jgi:hypothetical protein
MDTTNCTSSSSPSLKVVKQKLQPNPKNPTMCKKEKNNLGQGMEVHNWKRFIDTWKEK